MSDIQIVDWGLIDYNQALEKQLELVQQVSQNQSAGYIVLCTHPAVVTMGRKATQEDILDWQGQVIEVSRGGKATYHGPNQVVAYPIVNLNLIGKKRPAKDLPQYIFQLGDAIASVLKNYGLNCQAKTGGEETGVWLENRKLASIGIAVKQWISYHGIALNLDEDQNAFKGMRPCGFEASVMLSVEAALGKKLPREEVKIALVNELLARL